MSSKPNPKAFMYLALGTVVVGGAICFFQYSKLGDIDSRIAKLKTQVSDPKEVQKKLDDSNMKLDGARQSLAHLEGNVSDVSYVPSLLRDLDTYGKANSISVTGVKPIPKRQADNLAQANAKKPYDELVIQVTGSGTFDAIKSFVENLQKFPKIVAAHMVSIEPARSTGPDVPKGTLAMTVELKAYVFKPDTSTAASATGTTAPGSTAGTPAAGARPATGAPTTPAGKPGQPIAPPTGNAAPAVKTSPAAAGKTAGKFVRRVRNEG